MSKDIWTLLSSFWILSANTRTLLWTANIVNDWFSKHRIYVSFSYYNQNSNVTSYLNWCRLDTKDDWWDFTARLNISWQSWNSWTLSFYDEDIQETADIYFFNNNSYWWWFTRVDSSLIRQDTWMEAPSVKKSLPRELKQIWENAKATLYWNHINGERYDWN